MTEPTPRSAAPADVRRLELVGEFLQEVRVRAARHAHVEPDQLPGRGQVDVEVLQGEVGLDETTLPPPA